LIGLLLLRIRTSLSILSIQAQVVNGNAARRLTYPHDCRLNKRKTDYVSPSIYTPAEGSAPIFRKRTGLDIETVEADWTGAIPTKDVGKEPNTFHHEAVKFC
jgi:hypothetical protein